MHKIPKLGEFEPETARPMIKRKTGGTTKSVKYSVFVPMLIKALQELKGEVDLLKQ